MKFGFKVLTLLSVCLLTGHVEAFSQQKKSDKKKKGKVEMTAKTAVADTTKKAPKEIPSIEKFIKPTAQKYKGMFNVYVQDEKYFVEIPDNLLKKDILVFVSLVQGSAQKERSPREFLGYAGDAIFSKMVNFEKGPNDKLFLKEPLKNVIFPDSTADLYRASVVSNLEPIGMAFDVKAKGANSVLVDFTEIYNSDNQYFSLKGTFGAMNIGNYQADKSYPTTISAFENNVIFRSIKSYGPGKPTAKVGAPKDAPKVEQGPTIWEVASSWYLLPEEPMKPRIADTRVGYFTKSYTDYQKNPVKGEMTSFACRWRIEPKPEDVERYKRGELVEPVKPIVFYIDRNAPEYLHPYLIAGVQEWQKSFEKIGFKNAIIAKMMPTPEEDPNFSPEDARYSIVSYKASPIPNAYGPQVNDPRTGEVICSHIALFHNVMDLVQSWYFTQCAPNDPRVRQFPLDKNLMGELMQYNVAHEVGHTLGLRHNYAGSWTYSIAELRDNDFVKNNSHGSTIMDYMRFNYVTQPEDKIEVKNLIPRISYYDDFAIAWGYKYMPECKNVYEESEALTKWVTEQRKANPRVFFGTEIDREDPRFQAEDLTNDVIEANRLGLKNLKLLMKNLEEWTAGDDENYTLLRTMYKNLVGQYGRYMNHVTKFVGGRYADTQIRSEGIDNYIPVPVEIQKKAMAFLEENLLAEQTWMTEGRVPQITGFDRDAYYTSIYNNLFKHMASKFRQFDKHETLIGDKAYSFQDMNDELYRIVFTKALTGAALSSQQRIMQNAYMMSMMEAASEKSATSLMMATTQLEKIAKDAKRAAAKTTDSKTKAHLQSMASIVESWVAGDKKTLLN